MATKETKASSDAKNDSNVSVTTPKVAKPLFTKVRNVANRPLELIFSDGGEPLRIASKSTSYIDEARLATSESAKRQLAMFVKSNSIRILKEKCEKEV